MLTKSQQLGLYYKDEKGESKPVVLGSYGIGITRLMGTIVEVFSDDKGIVWPKGVAPFAVHLVSILGKSPDVIAESDRIYEMLTQEGIEVLYDDRDVRAGEKFADADLIGIPERIVVSEKTIAQGGVELFDRTAGTASLLPESAILQHFES